MKHRRVAAIIQAARMGCYPSRSVGKVRITDPSRNPNPLSRPERQTIQTHNILRGGSKRRHCEVTSRRVLSPQDRLETESAAPSRPRLTEKSKHLTHLRLKPDRSERRLRADTHRGDVGCLRGHSPLVSILSVRLTVEGKHACRGREVAQSDLPPTRSTPVIARSPA